MTATSKFRFHVEQLNGDVKVVELEFKKSTEISLDNLKKLLEVSDDHCLRVMVGKNYEKVEEDKDLGTRHVCIDIENFLAAIWRSLLNNRSAFGFLLL